MGRVAAGIAGVRTASAAPPRTPHILPRISIARPLRKPNPRPKPLTVRCRDGASEVVLDDKCPKPQCQKMVRSADLVRPWPPPVRRVSTRQYHKHVYTRGAPRPGLLNLPPREGAGKTGCALHPRSRAQLHKTKRTRAYRFSGSIPAFPAQWFYGFLRALLGDRAFLSPSSLRTSQELDASVGASGPHDFAVRFTRVRPARAWRPPHLTARFVTIASRPSCRVRRASL